MSPIGTKHTAITGVRVHNIATATARIGNQALFSRQHLVGGIPTFGTSNFGSFRYI